MAESGRLVQGFGVQGFVSSTLWVMVWGFGITEGLRVLGAGDLRTDAWFLDAWS